MPMRRAAYIAALKAERASVLDRSKRLSAIDDELARFGEKPPAKGRRGRGPQTGIETAADPSGTGPAGGVLAVDGRGVIAEQSGAPVESAGGDDANLEPGV